MSKLAGVLLTAATVFAVAACQPQDQPPPAEGEQSALGSQDDAAREDRTAAADRRESEQERRQSEQESFRRDPDDSPLESPERR